MSVFSNALIVLLCLVYILDVYSTGEPGDTCGTGPGTEQPELCVTSICRGSICCNETVGESCLACSSADGFCTRNNCFTCTNGESCVKIGPGFGCCKAEVLSSCFRGCDLNGNCFPLAITGESCIGDFDCLTGICKGVDIGQGVCCTPGTRDTCDECEVGTGVCLRDSTLVAIISFSVLGGVILILLGIWYVRLYLETEQHLSRLILEPTSGPVVVIDPEDDETVDAHIVTSTFDESGLLVEEVVVEEENSEPISHIVENEEPRIDVARQTDSTIQE